MSARSRALKKQQIKADGLDPISQLSAETKASLRRAAKEGNYKRILLLIGFNDLVKNATRMSGIDAGTLTAFADDKITPTSQESRKLCKYALSLAG